MFLHKCLIFSKDVSDFSGLIYNTLSRTKQSENQRLDQIHPDFRFPFFQLLLFFFFFFSDSESLHSFAYLGKLQSLNIVKEIYICICIFKRISSFFLLLKSLKLSTQNIQPLRKSPNHIAFKIAWF